MVNQKDDQQAVVWAVLIGVILLAIGLAIGVGLYRTNHPVGADVAAQSQMAENAAVEEAPAQVVAASTEIVDTSDNREIEVDEVIIEDQDGNVEDMVVETDTPTARVASSDGVVNYYFDSDDARIAMSAPDDLADLLKRAGEDGRIAIRGDYDPGGDDQTAKDLAGQRQQSLRDILVDLGVSADRIDMRPLVAAGVGVVPRIQAFLTPAERASHVAAGSVTSADVAASRVTKVSAEDEANKARVVVDDGAVKFYFATGKADLADGASVALADIIKGVATGKTAVISGFHDLTGGADLNEALAKARAFAVRDALMQLGVGEDKIELRKPQETTASGRNDEARRVEVTLE